MIRKLLRIFTVATAAIALAGVPATAQADHYGIDHFRTDLRYSNNDGSIVCQLPYLATGWWRFEQCAKISSNAAVFGYFSLSTKDFYPQTDPPESYPVTENRVVEEVCTAIDGYSGICLGFPVVFSFFGPVTRATQYRRDGLGRWGWYSTITGHFNPDVPGNTGWSLYGNY